MRSSTLLRLIYAYDLSPNIHTQTCQGDIYGAASNATGKNVWDEMGSSDDYIILLVICLMKFNIFLTCICKHEPQNIYLYCTINNFYVFGSRYQLILKIKLNYFSATVIKLVLNCSNFVILVNKFFIIYINNKNFFYY